ncbi:exodeoxyribonuclease VII large subunit [Flavihumibacter fluvii]|uniref:exodeoxyribonuclease VII large subunit n=1 Tax=Flavihumibacter fluvii TaxID=2838157 RepID=UPI001BDF384D|nr:exodeoxyribonuclease VII large subunit [Flavihumibacter fluvii]ULQ51903.1 exodeoxyribonuclease VII large subunit [Flavihumibacter fluvii]
MSSPLRLSQLSLLLQEVISETFSFRRFWVVAEISNHSFYAQKGFHYFDLIETEKAGLKSKGSLITKMAAVAWSAGAARIKAFEAATGQRFGNDLQVLAEVTVDFHPVYGLKLTLVDIDPRFTLGLLEQQRQATINRLLDELPDYIWKEGERIMTFNQDLQLPVVIQRVAIISSSTAAGYEDFLHSLEENPFGYHFITHAFFTTVQGENNAPALAASVEKIVSRAEEDGLDYDAVVIIRGGGASTDLLIFDQFEIAAAVASCPFPVITGIGHLKNETITDLVANTALKTPTKVAEFIIQHNRTFENSLTGLQQSLIIHAQQYMTGAKQELQSLRSALAYQTQANIFHHRSVLQQVESSIKRMPGEYLRNKQANVDNLVRLFKMASPEKVLQRGFAIIELKGKIISDAATVSIGDELTIILSGTAIDSTVHQKKPYNGKPFEL